MGLLRLLVWIPAIAWMPAVAAEGARAEPSKKRAGSWSSVPSAMGAAVPTA